MALYNPLIISLFFILIFGNYVSADPPCRTPNNDPGECMIIKKCSALYKILQKRPITKADANFLRQSQCGLVRFVPKVCCPLTSSLPKGSTSTRKPFTCIPVNTDETNGDPLKSGLLPDKLTCGQDNHKKIYGGEKADIDEFPWMALIEYEEPNRQRGLYCGGVLISKRYVLTASHCLKGKGIPKTWKLVSVRLGEYDTKSNIDCVNNGFTTECIDPPVNVQIEKAIAHEKYDLNQSHDIALLRLIRDVEFTIFIEPICLPLAEEERSKTYTGSILTVSGWGQTERGSGSNLKLNLKVPVQSQDMCNSMYREANIFIGDNQLCAGGEEGKDSCKGDSGGPLMSLSADKDGSMNWYAAGVVSFGPYPCGLEGWPSVYTRVSKYMKWIIENIEP